MANSSAKIAERIRAFVDHPVTILVKGLVLLTLGLIETSRTLREDLAHGRLRVGHGMVVIGLFGVLSALPDLIEGLDAGTKYLDSQQLKMRDESDKPNG